MKNEDHIRSYTLRLGRISKNKIETHHAEGYKYEIDANLCDFEDRIVEIGFGDGKSIINYALLYPNRQFVGIEMYQNGIYTATRECLFKNIANLKIVHDDAYTVVVNHIKDNQVAGFNVFFPDPWHKKRHHKRRLLKPEFLQILKNKLAPNGYLYMITDNDDYALEIAQGMESVVNMTKFDDDEIMQNRIKTSFETKALQKNHTIHQFFCRKS